MIKKPETISGLDGLKEEFLGRKYKFHATNKMFRLSLLRDNAISFPEGKLYEDVFTTYKAFLYANRVSLIPSILYFYLQDRSDSIMNVSLKPERFYDMYEALHTIINNPLVRKQNLCDYIKVLYCVNVISLTNYVYPYYRNRHCPDMKLYKQFIFEDSCAYLLKEGLRCPMVLFPEKIRIYLIVHHFEIYCGMMRLIKLRRLKAVHYGTENQ